MSNFVITDNTFEHNNVIYPNSLAGLKKFIRTEILPPGDKIPYDHLILNGTDIKLWYSKLVKGLGYWQTRPCGILKKVYAELPSVLIVQSIEIIPAKVFKCGGVTEVLEESEVRVNFLKK